ncbi:MAG: 23S rRNA (uracil(1939)-C(5))-methyltransferase RlmD, partial [Mogibacterium sp.]|nr:23S rRNA (uracil(1939)-C(5))-methyltransferase RlmD [Mogibacterium sp.]
NLVNALVEKFPQITTIIQNVNPRKTSIVLQDESIVLYGNGTITDELCNLKITFSHNAFYQIHSEQCEVLYDIARKKLNLSKNDIVLDTYCGVGTIGLTLADSCKKVIGVEINSDSIENAKLNARQNQISNIDFVSMDSTKFMQETKNSNFHFDAIVLDPPRAGTTKEFIEAACSLEPEKILYISCDARTMMRDLNDFRKNDYVTDEIDLVDMFPNTEHIECVALLTKRKKKPEYKKNYKKPRKY